ncbi:hypothetical protein [Latilactobacillus sakei]|uniref:hypothetical protein n=1 Tax=Latilactobacillus sakei TaxID=1599 RepID=UPI00202F792E|nr:hypothetical protein [Latilactobacillus sakei]MCM1636542.1 hypothetical protein [Latilactobacillus sakei]
MFKIFSSKKVDNPSMKNTWSIQFIGDDVQSISSMKKVHKLLAEDGALLKYQLSQSMQMVRQRTDQMKNEYFLLVQQTYTNDVELNSFKLKLNNLLDTEINVRTVIIQYPGNINFTKRRVLDMIDFVE